MPPSVRYAQKWCISNRAQDMFVPNVSMVYFLSLGRYRYLCWFYVSVKRYSNSYDKSFFSSFGPSRCFVSIRDKCWCNKFNTLSQLRQYPSFLRDFSTWIELLCCLQSSGLFGLWRLRRIAFLVTSYSGSVCLLGVSTTGDEALSHWSHLIVTESDVGSLRLNKYQWFHYLDAAVRRGLSNNNSLSSLDVAAEREARSSAGTILLLPYQTLLPLQILLLPIQSVNPCSCSLLLLSLRTYASFWSFRTFTDSLILRVA